MRDPGLLRSDRSPRRSDLAGAPRRGTRPALGAPVDAIRVLGPGGARALECLPGRRAGNEPRRTVPGRRDARLGSAVGAPFWGRPPSRSRGIALHQTSIRRRPSPPSHATPPRRLARGTPGPHLVRARPVGGSAPRAWCPARAAPLEGRAWRHARGRHRRDRRHRRGPWARCSWARRRRLDPAWRSVSPRPGLRDNGATPG